MIPLVAQSDALRLFGVTLIGATPGNGRKLLLSVLFVFVVLGVAWLLRFGLAKLSEYVRQPRVAFWGRQVVNILAAIVLFFSLASIWFDDASKLTTVLGLFTAGLGFALQRVITATAGYFVILRGKNFNVGDRIVMGGVRGDVIALSFMQTTIMEMGQPPGEQGDDPSMWVKSRQYTGRIVSISNAKIFDEPVYNYTQDFPFIWEEMTVPIRYGDDRRKAEEILLAAARRHTVRLSAVGKEGLAELQRRYAMQEPNVGARVYWRLTDNWLEMSVRFLACARGTRELKDAMTRDILTEFDRAGIGIASATYEIVGVPPLELEPPRREESRRDAAR